MERISIEYFKKVELRIGKIIEVKEHPEADKLFILKVDFGDEEKTIVTGLRGHYKIEELDGRKAVFVVNLEPAVLRGVESDGMILAGVSDDRKNIKVLFADKAEVGMRIS